MSLVLWLLLYDMLRYPCATTHMRAAGRAIYPPYNYRAQCLFGHACRRLVCLGACSCMYRACSFAGSQGLFCSFMPVIPAVLGSVYDRVAGLSTLTAWLAQQVPACHAA